MFFYENALYKFTFDIDIDIDKNAYRVQKRWRGAGIAKTESN